MKKTATILLGVLAVAPADQAEILIDQHLQQELSLAIPNQIVYSFSNDPLMSQEDYSRHEDIYGSALLSIQRARVWYFLQEPHYADQFISLAGKQIACVNKDLAQRIETILTTPKYRDQKDKDLESIGKEIFGLSTAAGYDTSRIEYTIFYNPKNKR